ncbi:hypothetical protein ACHAWT_005626 [Skeletonema menzelii]|mmetsp:Transcript_5567/g.9141  ORF Transcript_5567/g.9141 Transcript_5567/m.9141 type:complete len:166 (-) Transcript_5567:125-622(-)
MMTLPITPPRRPIHLYLLLLSLLLGLLQCTLASENEILNPFTNGFNSNNNNNGSGCRLLIEKNEWASGCIPAVNFVVKLVDCGEGTAMSDITVTFQDENSKELGRDYFVSPQNQCTVSGYGNIKTITPRGGSRVFINASADLCGRHGGDVVVTSSATSGQVTDCF